MLLFNVSSCAAAAECSSSKLWLWKFSTHLWQWEERNFKIAFNDFPCSGSAGHFGPELETHRGRRARQWDRCSHGLLLVVKPIIYETIFPSPPIVPNRGLAYIHSHSHTHARSQFHGKAAIIDYLFLGSSALPTSWRYLNFPSRDDCEEIVYQISTLIFVYIIRRRKSLVLRLLIFSFLFWEWKII